MAFVTLVSLVSGIFFTLQGAWPVMGFFGLEVVLLYAAFRWNYFMARRYERVAIGQDSITVSQISPRGEQSDWSFNPYWIKIDLIPAQHDPSLAGELVFSSHGQRLPIGHFLSAEEKKSLYDALTAAIYRIRHG